ncbi:uncharacterized protein ACHE_60051A [Aspergillus chevalieri]|uniref:Uncharacterized protein n=1 Tax=Aspergillus chevalieri TaxID=182096 RepID=A0A7R7VSV7_ASPCH|nr:uncharacterized protein ACHE_60051A [Aspergillus chevalieri]BCR90165.1 hypothetical protein ACHE_60051A [Aspergillus chevalieri]
MKVNSASGYFHIHTKEVLDIIKYFEFILAVQGVNYPLSIFRALSDYHEVVNMRSQIHIPPLTMNEEAVVILGAVKADMLQIGRQSVIPYPRCRGKPIKRVFELAN